MTLKKGQDPGSIERLKTDTPDGEAHNRGYTRNLVQVLRGINEAASQAYTLAQQAATAAQDAKILAAAAGSSSSSSTTTTTTTASNTGGGGGAVPSNVKDLVLIGGTDATTFTTASASFQWDDGLKPTASDFQDYQVQIIEPASGTVLRTEYVTNPFYTYTHDKNQADSLAAGFASAIRIFSISVKQRNTVGNLSAIADVLTVQNPSLTAAFTLVAFSNEIQVSYPKPTNTSFLGTVVYLSTTTGFTPSSANIAYDGPAYNAAIITSVTPGGAQIQPGTTYYLRIAIRDTFGIGTPSAEMSITTTSAAGSIPTPTAPSGLALSTSVTQNQLFTTSSILASWTPGTSPDGGQVATELTYWTTDPTKTTVVTTTASQYLIYPTQPGVTYSVKIRSVYFTNYSAFTATQTIAAAGDTTAPNNVTGWTAQAGLDKVTITYLNPTSTNWQLTQIYRGTNASFTPESDNQVSSSMADTVVDANMQNNLFSYTESFNSGGWAQSAITIAANNTNDPYGGVNTAAKATPSTANGTHGVSQTITAVTTFYTFSVFAKANGYNFVFLTDGTNGVYFNVSAGAIGTTVGTVSAKSIVAQPNGWYRCIVTIAETSGSKTFTIRPQSADNQGAFAGDGTSGVFLFGAQLEQNVQTVSPYMPTPTTIGSGTLPTYFYKTTTTSASGVASAASTAFPANGVSPLVISTTNSLNFVGSNAINNAQINNLDAGKITTGFLASARIAAGTITAAQISVSQLSALAVDAGAISAGQFTLNGAGSFIATDTGLTGHVQRVILDSTNGIRAINSSGVTVAQIGTDGSGTLGVAGSFGSISWSTSGQITFGGTTTFQGTLTGPLFRTASTSWRAEIGPVAGTWMDDTTSVTYTYRYWDGTQANILFGMDQAGRVGFRAKTSSSIPSIAGYGDRGDGTNSLLVNISLTSAPSGSVVTGTPIMQLGNNASVATGRIGLYIPVNSPIAGLYVESWRQGGSSLGISSVYQPASFTAGTTIHIAVQGASPCTPVEAANNAGTGYGSSINIRSALSGKPTHTQGNLFTNNSVLGTTTGLYAYNGSSWDKIAVAGLAATSGWAELGAGVIKNWGILASASYGAGTNTVSGPITYQQPFTTLYGIQLTVTSASTTIGSVTLTAVSPGTSSFQINVNNSAGSSQTFSVYWEAIGLK